MQTQPSAVKDDFIKSITGPDFFVQASDLSTAGNPGNPADPPKPPDTAATGAKPVDESAFLKSLGSFETMDQLKSVVQRGQAITEEEFNNLPKLRTAHATATDLQTQLTTLTQTPPFKNPILAKLDKLEQTDPETFQLANKVLLGNAEDIELIRFNMIRTNPALKDNPAALQRKIQRTYPALYEKEINPESDAYINDQDDLHLEAEKIRAEVRKKVETIELPTWPTANLELANQAKAQVKEVEDSWNLAKASLAARLDPQIPITFMGEDKKVTEAFKLDVPVTELNPFLDQAVKGGIGQGKKFINEFTPAVIETAKRLWIINNLDTYNSMIISKIAKVKEVELRLLASNPGSPGSVVIPGGGEAVDAKTELFHKVITNL